MSRVPIRPGSPPGTTTPRGALLTVWVVVNLVNLLQAAGFASRVVDPNINRMLGIGIVALGVPATMALVSFVRSRRGWRFYAGPLSFLLFVGLAIAVDYVLDTEFRSPRRPEILVPYLILFFGSVLLMGVQLFRIDRRLWAVTALTTLVLLGAMGYAMAQGVA